MAISRPPPPKKQEKSGLGCLGCGCLILAVIVLLVIGLIGGTGYVLYKDALEVTSTEAGAFPPYNGSDDIYAGAQKKLDAFNHDVGTGKPATLTLSADEINAELAHNPLMMQYHVRILVTMQGQEARLQGTVPVDMVPFGLFKGRYLNIDTTFGLGFNPDSKNLDFQFQKVQIGETPAPDNSLPAIGVNFSQVANKQLRKTAAWSVIQVSKTIAIKDGQLVIETK